MTVLTSATILTKQYNQFLNITDIVVQAVRDSGVTYGIVNVITKHTTTGIMVNESLECLESDIADFLTRMAPEEGAYAHARMLPEYGSTAGNPTGHLKAHITGNHCHFIVDNGCIIKGGAQEVYFCEFDGPAKRTILIQVIGE